MKVIAGGTEYQFTPEKIMNTEWIAIERVSGFSVAQFEDKVAEGSMLALTALVWVLRKRKEPTLRFEQVEFEGGSVDVIPDPVEESTEGKANGENDSTHTG